ncbi:GNAT family N-acetyltransferase [Streptomyces sp. NPDC017248]|uniref:GNAT family N-acetyltransferase n=1 Tax=unclassified Streptomyces TaxID=2593676 RepID=UPI003796D0C2
MTPVLRTERLDFLPYRPEHEDVFVALLRDEEVCRWMGQDLVPEPQLRELFRAILDDVYPRRRFDVWGLWLADAYVGHAEVKPTGNVDGHELVTALAPAYWGRGLGGEVVRGLLAHAADNLGLSEAYGMVGAGNTASLAMCRRLGFRHVRDVVDDDGAVTKLLVIPTRQPDEGTTAGGALAVGQAESAGDRPEPAVDRGESAVAGLEPALGRGEPVVAGLEPTLGQQESVIALDPAVGQQASALEPALGRAESAVGRREPVGGAGASAAVPVHSAGPVTEPPVASAVDAAGPAAAEHGRGALSAEDAG